ncbi:OmpA family protein [Roseivivax jejudonensis]|nr:OmpA family protein [Roseivivax jejudonensis]
MAAVVLPSSEAQAQAFTRDTPSQQGRDQGQYIPNVALTPDGCEVWVLDDGAEGYASNRLTRQGVPVCRRQNVCGVMNTDQYFATDRYRVSKAGRARLVEFFRASDATAFAIVGHTDSRASDEYNMRLSYNRANAVAAIGREVGARIVDVRGYGERLPVASNNSAAGMAKNRRVEILCYQ